MSWPLVAVLMIAEIVSNGMLSLPSSLAVVGVVPGVIVIVFLGVFATFTSWLLIQFKLRHPQGERYTDSPVSLLCCAGSRARCLKWLGLLADITLAQQSTPWAMQA